MRHLGPHFGDSVYLHLVLQRDRMVVIAVPWVP